MSGVWTMHEGGETAHGAAEPVVVDGEVIAAVAPIWSDEDGVRVSIDWQRHVFDGITALGDLSPEAARVLAEVLTAAANVPPPILGDDTVIP